MKTRPSDAKKERQYINLGGGDDFEDRRFPDECFEEDDENYIFLHQYDDDDEDEVARKAEDEDRKSRLIGEICFLSGVFIAGAAVMGLIAFISKVIIYPIVSKIAKSLDW